MANNIQLVSIEGNIGSGKSTLLEHLRQQYATNPTVIFLKEPVDDWMTIKDANGETILQKFYANQEKYSFPFQMMAYISRLKILKEAVDRIVSSNNGEKYTIITERCLHTDKHVFAQMLFDQHKIEDVCFQIYLNWFDTFAKQYPITHLVYVETTPEICHHRVHQRDRVGETIPLDYLQACHQYHTQFIQAMHPVERFVLNGNLDIYEDATVMEEWLEKLKQFISGSV